MNIKYKDKLFALLFALSFLTMSCDKEDAMVVDRVVSPVLVSVSATNFTSTEPVKVTATIMELDKSEILNHAVGIDSIPVSNLAITVKLNNNTLAQLTTDQAGMVTIDKTWAELGLVSPKTGNALNLEWSGSYKGQAFTKQTKIQVK